MYKSILLSATLSASLFANSITFKNAPTTPLHILPTGKNKVFSFHEILKAPMNAVVNISTKTMVQHNQRDNSLYSDPFFQELFRGQVQPQHQAPSLRDNALGSGVIVSTDGYIVTNNHVLTDADEIAVTLKGSDKVYKAKVIGKDKDSDLAVIKIDAKDLKPIEMGHIKDVFLGDVVFAIGNPFGVGETVTQGIVSALNKEHVGINKYEHFIQTDASINPGNSGGALIDSRGALIGINAAILSKTGGNHGIGFSIPVDMVRNVVTKLIKSGKVTRGYLGVNIDKLTPELQKFYTHKKGAIITNIQLNTPAHKASLQRGDLIFNINGKAISSPSSLQRFITSLNPNDKITIAIERNKKVYHIELQLGDLNGDEKSSSKNYIELEGLRLSELSYDIKQSQNIDPNAEGVFIEGVLERSQAERSGFIPGDIIIQIENRHIKTLQELKSAFKKYKGVTKRVYINRSGVINLLVMAGD